MCLLTSEKQADRERFCMWPFVCALIFDAKACNWHQLIGSITALRLLVAGLVVCYVGGRTAPGGYAWAVDWSDLDGP